MPVHSNTFRVDMINFMEEIGYILTPGKDSTYHCILHRLIDYHGDGISLSTYEMIVKREELQLVRLERVSFESGETDHELKRPHLGHSSLLAAKKLLKQCVPYIKRDFKRLNRHGHYWSY